MKLSCCCTTSTTTSSSTCTEVIRLISPLLATPLLFPTVPYFIISRRRLDPSTKMRFCIPPPPLYTKPPPLPPVLLWRLPLPPCKLYCAFASRPEGGEEDEEDEAKSLSWSRKGGEESSFPPESRVPLVRNGKGSSKRTYMRQDFHFRPLFPERRS